MQVKLNYMQPIKSFKTLTCLKHLLHYLKSIKADFCVSDRTFGPTLCETFQFIMCTYLNCMIFVQYCRNPTKKNPTFLTNLQLPTV